jgi:hypothetical protein
MTDNAQDKSGGPAFPGPENAHPENPHPGVCDRGMSARFYAAVQLAAGWLAHRSLEQMPDVMAMFDEAECYVAEENWRRQADAEKADGQPNA